MTWEDLDMENCIASVTKSMTKTKEGGQFTKEPKTDASIRDLTLPEECFVLLRQWKMEQMALCGNLGTQWLGHRNIRKKTEQWTVLIRTRSSSRWTVACRWTSPRQGTSLRKS